MTSVEMALVTYIGRTRCIVCYGPATPTTGMRAGDYYQVTIDPNVCSPSGQYIRFGLYKGDEIVGWQRVDCITVVESLGLSDDPALLKVDSDPSASVVLNTVI